MPYGSRKQKRRRDSRRRRRTAPKKAKYHVSTRKLADKRINTLVEKRMSEVAQKEAAKLIPPNLVFRRYLFADYDMNLNRMGNYTPVGWTGIVVSLAQIPKMDNVTQAVNTSVPQQPDQMLRPNPQYNFGAAVVAPHQVQGYRSGNTVSIKNIQFGLRVRHNPLVTGRTLDIVQDGGPAAPAQTTIWNQAAFEHSFTKWAIVTTQDDLQSGVGWEPTPDRVLPMKKFGYSSRLDIGVSEQTAHQKFKTLMSGTIKNTYQQYQVAETQREYFKKGLSLPIEYQYDDLYGQQVIGVNKLFLVVRSNIPDAGPAGQFRPQIGAYIKLGYKNIS